MSMWNVNEIAVHYVEDQDLSIQWLPNSYHTVQEYNFWDGVREDAGTRKCVLMETNHEAVLKISNLLTEGDPTALQALAVCHKADPKSFCVLGYDFQLDCPRVIINFK